jgi:DNA-binding response OmpR family regulator
MINVLIFSEQNKYSNNLVEFLSNNDCKVHTLLGIIQKISSQLIFNFDAILIDLEIKKTNGYAILSKIRDIDLVIPVLVISSNNLLSEKIFAYKLGADDYILKSNPFEESLFRINVLKKKIELNKYGLSNDLIIDDLRINLKTLDVYRNDIEIKLTKKEFLVLKTLAESRGQIINKIELMRKLWKGEDKTKSNVVEVCVNSLRKKIDKNFDPKMIHTKIGLGYYIN